MSKSCSKIQSIQLLASLLSIKINRGTGAIKILAEL